MSKVHDITGQKFCRLTVIHRAENNKYNRAQWFCQCECGNTLIVSGNALLKGNTKSCGCLNLESSRKTKNNKHHMSNTRIFHIWGNMKSRCNCESNRHYNDYGGRGISVCQEWNDDFINFYNWSMQNGYDDSLSLDRIDNNGNYCPENCRWANQVTQNNNKRTNIQITYKGETKTIAQWAEVLNIDRKNLERRIRSGWEIEKAIETPIRKRRKAR